MGAELALASGDQRGRVQHVAAELGVARFGFELTPREKAAFITNLDRAALVGDGVNDAPAAAAANVSFAVSESASLNRGVADVVLLAADLELVPWTLALARRALTSSRRVLLAATVYNASFVTLAACGYLRPVWAGVSMLVASIIALIGGARMEAYGERPARTAAVVTSATTLPREEVVA